MGADLCLVYAPLDLDYPQVAARFAALVEDPSPLTDEANDLCLAYDDDDLEDQAQALLSDIALVLDATYHGGWCRDITTCLLDGRWWVFTGGLSAGDEPTDSYNAVIALATLALTYDHWDLHHD